MHNLFGTELNGIIEAVKVAVYKPNFKFIPSSFNGRIKWKNYITGIMNQGECGGCYV